MQPETTNQPNQTRLCGVSRTKWWSEEEEREIRIAVTEEVLTRVDAAGIRLEVPKLRQPLRPTLPHNMHVIQVPNPVSHRLYILVSIVQG
jgi:hypothetical protein